MGGSRGVAASAPPPPGHRRRRRPTHREEVAERDVGEDLVSSVPRALALALSPELLELVQQRPRGAEEEGVLLGDGVV